MLAVAAIVTSVPIAIFALMVAVSWSALGAPAWAARLVGRAPFFGK